MIIKLALIICVIFALNGAEAFNFYEDITVGGAGKLVCRTDTELAKDWVDASGPQTYSRNVKWDIEKETASLKSNYSIDINSANHNSSDDDNNKSDGIVNNLDNINININNSDNISVNINNSDGFYIDSYNKSKENSSLNSATSAGRDPPETASSKANPSVSNQKSDLPDDNSRHDSVGQRDTNSNDLPDYYKYSTFKVTNRSNQQKELPSDGGSPSRNHYGIRMTYPNQLEHEIEVTGADNFTANNSISFDGGSVSTNYVMKGKGDLKGSVIESGPMGKPHQMAKTEIKGGDFKIGSGVDDEAQIGEESESDALSKEADQVKTQSKGKEYQKPGKDNASELLNTEEKQREKQKDELLKEINNGVKPEGQANGPELQNNYYNKIRGQKIVINAAEGVLANDLDPQNPEEKSKALEVVNITQPAQGGNVKMDPDGSFSYDPPNSTYCGLINFSYTAKIIKTGVTTDGYVGIHIKCPDGTPNFTANGGNNSGKPENDGETENKKTYDGTIIPANLFGSAINSTYRSGTPVISGTPWDMAYIGNYPPPKNESYTVGTVPGYYTVKRIEGIYELTSINKTGDAQKYLRIGSSSAPINKIRMTPPNARFSILITDPYSI